MAATTSPDGIAYPTLTDQGDDLAVLFANLANSTQTAITSLRNSIPTTIANALTAHKGVATAVAVGSVTRAGPYVKGNSYSQAVTFPAGRFTQAPLVVLQSSRSRVNVSPSSITSTGFSVNLENWSEGDEPGSVVITYWAAQA